MNKTIISGPVMLRSHTGNHTDIHPDHLGTIINGKAVFVGDVHTELYPGDGEDKKRTYYPIVFLNGCFCIDESRYRDASKPDQLTPIHLMTEPLCIIGRTTDKVYKSFLKSIV